ncbi:GNAT family N-acetyltransferase [uncultured Proteiniphilum sp.]|uniref:GNAT family N-acetyltransferase n=1 Tax=uncultured Proteiniphilum sp. TaxID=497637 RepID=UPI00261E69C3|nr:GNAT family N-acetyltransferase [uncultured Proteiniphilum sp.]
MDNYNYKIRNIKENDLDEVAHLYTLFWNGKMNLSKMKQKFSEISKNPNYIFLCAEESGKVIGTIQGVICEELYGECTPFLVMENFVVAENSRGKGVGRELLSELEKIGKEKNCSQIIFITETDRKETVGFYERVGFNSTSHKGFKKSLK